MWKTWKTRGNMGQVATETGLPIKAEGGVGGGGRV